MPSCALERCVEVISQRVDRQREAGLARLPTGFEVGAVEVDERELARHEQAGADGEQEPHAQHDVLHHASPPLVREAGRWGERLQLGGSSIVAPVYGVAGCRDPGARHRRWGIRALDPAQPAPPPRHFPTSAAIPADPAPQPRHFPTSAATIDGADAGDDRRMPGRRTPSSQSAGNPSCTAHHRSARIHRWHPADRPETSRAGNDRRHDACAPAVDVVRRRERIDPIDDRKLRAAIADGGVDPDHCGRLHDDRAVEGAVSDRAAPRSGARRSCGGDGTPTVVSHFAAAAAE